MVDDVQNRTVGYMGLAFIDWVNGTAEADAVVRGGDATRGLMSKALGTMLRWAKGQLGISQLGVRVRSDNSALEFYRKFGFCEVQRIPLRRVEQENMIQWVEDPLLQIAEPSLVHMVLSDNNENQ
jgi:RimJ/RimL family protein N-acetyltransferase